MLMKDSLLPAHIDDRLDRSAFRWSFSKLIAVGILSFVLVLGHVLWSMHWAEPVAPFNHDCEAWDRLASAAVSELIADRRPIVEQRLGDAVFRLRRARKYCRYDLADLARLDYEALTDGRYGRR
jgi:hypothetical protein